MENLFDIQLSQHKQKCGIYMIKIFNRLYIGSAINIASRLSSHRGSMKSQKHKNSFVQSCFNKHGENECQYVILEECLKDDRLIREKYWIKKICPDLNLIRDPTTQQNCITTSKIVYQYTLNGVFKMEHPSAQQAGRQLKIEGSTITKCCTGKYGHKSYGRSMWSYQKCLKLPEYINKSSKAKIKAVTMYTREGLKIQRFTSIANAARHIEETQDDFAVLCSCISSVSNGKGDFVKNKYRFSYEDHDKLVKSLFRNFPVIQLLPDGSEVKWENAQKAAFYLKGKAMGIHRVIRGERKRYYGFIWKSGAV
tara:strand:+ start:2967 stop:3893 length:927 start_codon:yes stop_codon:yes gene_type:complete